MNVLEFLLGDTPLSVLLSALLIIVLGYVAGRLLSGLLMMLSKKITKKTRSTVDDLIVGVLDRSSVWLTTLSAGASPNDCFIRNHFESWIFISK